MKRRTKNRSLIRALRHWWAVSRNFFWMPCPLCGEPFGGNEWTISGEMECHSIPHPDDDHMGTGICPWCEVERAPEIRALWEPLIRARWEKYRG